MTDEAISPLRRRMIEDMALQALTGAISGCLAGQRKSSSMPSNSWDRFCDQVVGVVAQMVSPTGAPRPNSSPE
jgi:hypothetical protein